MTGHPRPPLRDDPGNAGDFDRRLRLHYLQAATTLSARTRAQLQQRLRAARPPRARPGHRIAWALAAAGSLAVVIGVHQRWSAPDAAGPSHSMSANSASGNDQLVATLDETPDLYLWVASRDATAMTSE